ncbi:prolactin receptor isoform X2 [Hemicordylus capensis]|uniref:prolactin receptor isoform X2 n=1 Tax=Hemicordylus capensis TaxID=884348 RepID=UPI00230239F1|nr:prolactin receptor isoform X2 [Hemicordylus capensis]
MSLSVLFILLVSLNVSFANGQSPPGKPMINCRSSGNETFICQWKPLSDGGLPTNYTLLYSTERKEQTYECPDYVTAGPNSCHFDKNLTSLWKKYNITVKATNSMGSNISDLYYVDTASLVIPDPPTDVSLEVKPLNGIMYVLAKWSPPPLVSSWQKHNYELRVKPSGGDEWEVHFVGEQREYKMSPRHAGVKYVAQVRYMTEHGGMSAWSPESYIQLPKGQPPGKPELIRCRSPEKETFSCWWKPSSDGGLPTNYSLFYNKEGQEQYYECPDYKTSGPNSCYFDKKHTSIWAIYNFTIKATNEMGTNVSEPKYVDVTYIVQPNAPENLTLHHEKKDYEKEYLLLEWLPPSQTDVGSGWITLEYELRIKPGEGQEWDDIYVGQRTSHKIFSLNPGEKYIAQVRCKPDHGEWSEWSSESYIQLRKVRVKDMLVWIFVAFLLFVICLIMIWTMALKRINMVACILPPVPGPKIKGFDANLLEAGKNEELLSALGCQGFPPTSDYDELLVEYLEIDDSEDQQLMPSNEKNHPNKNAKLGHKETDNDSGRGSCESPSLVPEKCREARNTCLVLKRPDSSNMQEDVDRKRMWETPNRDSDGQFPCFSSGRSKSSTSPGAQQETSQTPKCSYHDTVEISKMSISTMNVNSPSSLMENEEKCCSQGDQEVLWLLPPEESPFLFSKPMDYVEVHKVNQNGALAVLPKQKEEPKEYTKVSTVVANHLLVLMPDPKLDALPSFQELPKESTQSCQQRQAEKNMSYCLTAPSTCKVQIGGLDYMDPNNFMCTFN